MEILFNAGGKTGAGGAANDGLIKDGATATFVADVIQASMQTPVIVDFWAPWCGPCKQLGPALEKLVREAKGAVRMVKINVDQNQELAAQMRIQSIPAVYAFKDGQPVDGFAGALPESQLKTFLTRLIGDSPMGNELDEILAQAQEILDEGDVQSAFEIYSEILTQDPANVAALAGVMRCQIAQGQADQAQALLDRLPPELQKAPDIATIRTQLELAAQAGEVGEAAELRRRLAADPDDHQARFDLAMAHFAATEREAAVEELLELVRRDRTWNDDAARKQLVKFFEAFGLADPLTLRSRRRLSTLLFS